MRGLPEAELVALARMDSLIPVIASATQTYDQPAPPVSHPVIEATATGDNSDSIYFVLSDDVLYTRISDFRNDSARTLYEQYIRLEQTQQQAEQMLDSLRRQYYEADATTRTSLEARIPILSDEIASRRRLLRNTLTQVRALETTR